MSLALLQADCKKAVASLSNLSNDELDKIINDDVRIQTILKDMEQVRIHFKSSTICIFNSKLF